jgi:hypothetical protein
MWHIVSQWGLQLIFRMHNSDPTSQRVTSRSRSNITALFHSGVYQKESYRLHIKQLVRI